MYNPNNIRPRDGWVVVLADPRKDKLESGVILAPNETGAEKVCEGSGRLIRVGQGNKNTLLGLEAGQRVLYRGFLKYANPIETEEKWEEDGPKKQYFLMSSEDVMGVLPEDLGVGVFSGRPQVRANNE